MTGSEVFFSIIYFLRALTLLTLIFVSCIIPSMMLCTWCSVLTHYWKYITKHEHIVQDGRKIGNLSFIWYQELS